MIFNQLKSSLIFCFSRTTALLLQYCTDYRFPRSQAPVLSEIPEAMAAGNTKDRGVWGCNSV